MTNLISGYRPIAVTETDDKLHAQLAKVTRERDALRAKCAVMVAEIAMLKREPVADEWMKDGAVPFEKLIDAGYRHDLTTMCWRSIITAPSIADKGAFPTRALRHQTMQTGVRTP